jgi:hypothetical protein
VCDERVEKRVNYSVSSCGSQWVARKRKNQGLLMTLREIKICNDFTNTETAICCVEKNERRERERGLTRSDTGRNVKVDNISYN